MTDDEKEILSITNTRKSKVYSILTGKMTIEELLGPDWDVTSLKRNGINLAIDLFRMPEYKFRLLPISTDLKCEIDRTILSFYDDGLHFGLTRDDEEILKWDYLSDEEQDEELKRMEEERERGRLREIDNILEYYKYTQPLIGKNNKELEEEIKRKLEQLKELQLLLKQQEQLRTESRRLDEQIASVVEQLGIGNLKRSDGKTK